MKLYTLYDKKAQSYSENVLVVPSDGVAIRVITMAMLRDPNLKLNATDFELYSIGSYDLDCASIDSKLEFVCSLGSLSDVVRKFEREQLDDEVVDD